MRRACESNVADVHLPLAPDVEHEAVADGGIPFHLRRSAMANSRTGSSNRGFASMDEDKQRAIASKGGRAAHASGNAHQFSPDEARVAGRKGGEAISQDRQHMAAIGREGGHARHASARQQQQQQNMPGKPGGNQQG
jgi:general stress protein YciG